MDFHRRKFCFYQQLAPKLKGKVCQSSVRLTILHGSEIRCLKNKMTILRKTRKSMSRTTCVGKLIEKRSSHNLIDLLSLVEAVNKLTREEMKCDGVVIF